jgi:predicted dehydrogenase
MNDPQDRNETPPSKPGAGASRRDFLRTAGAVTAGALLPGWGTVRCQARSSAFALQSPHVIGANDRIRIGAIGCGGMGSAHLRSMVDQSKKNEENIQVIAVCDIYEPRKNAAKALTGGAVYHDYRKLLENNDIDVVLIASPEHWHAQQAIDAMEAGKDLYLEKPLVRHLEDARKVYQTALRTKRIVQVGSQWTEEDKWRKADELIKAGKIGKPVWSQTSYCRNSKEGEWNYHIDDDASPGNLDWNAFLGTAPKRPFDKERFFRWRKYWDYSAGITSDLFPHVMHTLFIALDLDFPTRVTATGGIYVHPDREVPDTIHLLADFPSGHTMLVAGSTCNEQGLETLIRGHKANMYLGGDAVVIRPERVYAEEIEETREAVPGPAEDPMRVHEKNLWKCVRSREKPHCPIDLAYKVHVTVGLAELAYRQNKMMRWDAKKMEIVAG